MANNRAYVIVPDDVPLGFAMNGVAHAGCCMALKWGSQNDDAAFREWALNSFRKVTCKVERRQLVQLDEALLRHCGWGPGAEPRDAVLWLNDHRIIVTESDWNDGGVVAVVYKPRVDWPKMFRKLELYNA